MHLFLSLSVVKKIASIVVLLFLLLCQLYFFYFFEFVHLSLFYFLESGHLYYPFVLLLFYPGKTKKNRAIVHIEKF